MSTSDWIAIIAVIISILGAIYSFFTSTKKYELAREARKEILEWSSKVISSFKELKNELEKSNISKEELLNLSTLIDIGRFYFPNIDMKDNYGKNKPLAYRGYRNIVLDFLVYFYDICKYHPDPKYSEHLNNLERNFVSHIFEILSPYKHNKKVKKYTNIKMNKKVCIEDYLKNNPSFYDFFI